MSATCHRVDIELPSIRVRRARPSSGRPERTSTIVTTGVDIRAQDDSALYFTSERAASRGRLCARFLVAENPPPVQLCPRPPQEDKRILGFKRQLCMLQDLLEEKDGFIRQLVKRSEDATKTEPSDINKEREIVNIISTLQARIEVLHKQWLESRSLLDLKEDLIRQLQTDLEAAQGSEQHLRVLMERLQIQVHNFEGQQNKWAEARAALEGRDQRIQKLELEVTSLQESEQGNLTLIDSLKKQIWDYEAQQVAWRLREAEVAGLREQLAAADSRIADMEAEARKQYFQGTLQSWKDSYHEVMTKLCAVLGSGVDGIDAAVNKILGLSQQIASLKKDLDCQIQTSAHLKSENQSLLDNISKLKAERAMETSSVSNLTLELSNIRADRDSWRRKQSELEGEIASIRIQLESSSVTEKRASQGLEEAHTLHEKDRHTLVQRLSNLEKKYHNIVDKLRTLFGIDDVDIDVILAKIQVLRRDNISLRNQLSSNNLVGMETQSLRDTITRLRADLERERTATGACSAELSTLRMERDVLLSKQKQLELEVASLRHGSSTASHTLLSRDQQLDDLRGRISKLEADNSALQGLAQSHETRFTDFCEQLAALLSLQGQVTVLHTETAILFRLRQVIQELDEKTLRTLGLQSRVTSLTSELCEQCIQHRRDQVKQRRIQSDMHHIGMKLNKLETDMKDGRHLLCRGIPLHQDAYQVFLDQLADLFNVEVIAVDVGTDLSEDSLLVRAEEFARVQHSTDRGRTTVFRTPPRSANRSNGTCVLICSGRA